MPVEVFRWPVSQRHSDFLDQEKESGGELMIHCSQCGNLFKLAEIVAHWKEKHGYQIHGSNRSSTRS